jgi:hypothetical protein
MALAAAPSSHWLNRQALTRGIATSPWASNTGQGRLRWPISSGGMSHLRGETMRLVLALCLVLVMACVAMLFPAEVIDLISWVDDWFDEQS